MRRLRRFLAEKVQRVSIKSVRAIFRDISDILPEVVPSADGVHIGREAFYWASYRTASEWKTEIAEKCVKLIAPNITLACGPGSTVVYCIKRVIQEGHCFVIVTNNAGIIDHAANSRISDLVFVGGEYNANIHGCVGVAAVEGFKKAKCHAALVGVSGINEAGDLFVRHSEEVPVVREMIQSVSDIIFIVAHARKLIQVDAWKFINIRDLLEKKPHLEIHLITNPCKSLGEKDRDRAEHVVQELREKGVKIEWAQVDLPD